MRIFRNYTVWYLGISDRPDDPAQDQPLSAMFFVLNTEIRLGVTGNSDFQSDISRVTATKLAQPSELFHLFSEIQRAVFYEVN